MPVTRSPLGVSAGCQLDQDTPSNNPPQAQGVVVSAINALPLDVGTVVSPTLARPSSGQGSSTCSGGPGNPTCGLEVKEDQSGVQCDICGSWYHSLCQKLSRAAYNALTKHEALAFICDECRKRPNLNSVQPKPVKKDSSTQTLSGELPMTDNRIENSNPPLAKDTDMISHLISSVNAMEASIKENTKLMIESKKVLDTVVQEQSRSSPTFAEVLSRQPEARHTHMTGSSAPPSAALHQSSINPRGQQSHVGSGGNTSSTSNDYRHVVRAELREMEERKKRASSLVVRGLRVGSASEAAAKFGDIVHAMTGERVTWTEVCRIRSDTDLFRGNVHDNRMRRMILDEAKHLKDSEYSHVFIRRDLTFLQREELRARYPPRAQRQVWSSRQRTESEAQQEKHPQSLTSQPQRPECAHQSQETIPKQTVAVPSASAPATSNETPADDSDIQPTQSRSEGRDAGPEAPTLLPLGSEGN